MDSNPGPVGLGWGIQRAHLPGGSGRGILKEGTTNGAIDVNAIRAILNIALEDNPSTCYTGKRK